MYVNDKLFTNLYSFYREIYMSKKYTNPVKDFYGN